MLRRVTRLGQGIFYKGAVWLRAFGHGQIALANQRAIELRKHGLQLVQLALVIGCQNYFHKVYNRVGFPKKTLPNLTRPAAFH